MNDFNHMTQQYQAPSDFWEERYAKSLERSRGKAGQLLQQHITPMTPGRVLELGCSTGDDSLWLAEQGWKVTAVDISEQAIQTAQRLAKTAQLETQIQFLSCDLSVNFPSGDFELVTALYFQSPYDSFPRIDILQQAASRIVPGGYLFVVTHATGPSWVTPPESMPAFPTAEGDWQALGLSESDWQLEKLSVEGRVAKGPEGQMGEVKDNVILARRL
jgi:2-polyprenyl-3-methyl-5-hydroxy-6-metoxy-1,4-benzoquinol methylase